jgi:D-glycero-alpha-D-manno-heptose-7-phosphate kinase
MIITRTPLRVSFVGGGTDMPSFYKRHGGAVVSMAIDKYIYISINKKFDGRIRLSYSKTENVDKASELKHDLARACLEMYNLTGVEIISVSDIPGEGSGLGSSSAFVVGLLHAISEYVAEPCHSRHILAEKAYMIELGCGHPVGKQDHYASAYGGLHFFKFLKNDKVEVEPICFQNGEEKDFQDQLMLFWTGKTRKASSILKKQSENISDIGNAEKIAINMRDLAYQLKSDLLFGGIYNFGEYLHQNWELKKELAENISNEWFDKMYAHARSMGATGGKLCGAGGGGFLLLCAEPDYQRGLEASMAVCFSLKMIPIRMSEEGSKIIYEQA